MKRFVWLAISSQWYLIFSLSFFPVIIQNSILSTGTGRSRNSPLTERATLGQGIQNGKDRYSQTHAPILAIKERDILRKHRTSTGTFTCFHAHLFYRYLNLSRGTSASSLARTQHKHTQHTLVTKTGSADVLLTDSQTLADCLKTLPAGLGKAHGFSSRVGWALPDRKIRLVLKFRPSPQ